MTFKWLSSFIFLYTFTVSAQESITVVTHDVAGFEEAAENNLYITLLKEIYPDKIISADSLEFKFSIELFLNNKVDAIVAVYPHEVPNALVPNWILDKDLPITAYFLKRKFAVLPQISDSSLNVGWLHRYGFHKFFNVKNIYKVPSREIGFNMLEKGRLDVFLDYKQKNTQMDLRKFGNVDVRKGNYLYIAFQNNEKGKMLAKQYDERMLKLSKSGELKKIYSSAYANSGLSDFKLNRVLDKN